MVAARVWSPSTTMFRSWRCSVRSSAQRASSRWWARRNPAGSASRWRGSYDIFSDAVIVKSDVEHKLVDEIWLRHQHHARRPPF